MKTVLRFFISTTASVMLFTSVAQANMHHHDGSMHSVTGELRTRYEAIKNIELGDEKIEDGFYNRARINFDIMPADSLKVRITPQANHLWSSQGTTSDVNLFLKEGWMAWMPTDMIGLYVGRQALHYGSGALIGNRDWDDAAEQSFDAARVRFSFDMGNVDFFWSKLEDGGFGSGMIAPDQSSADLFALYAAFNLEDRIAFLRDLDVYGYVWWDNNNTGDSKYYVMGARAAGMVNMIDYSLEGTAEFGEVEGVDSQKGFWGQFDLGATFMDRHRVGVQMAYANNEHRALLGDYHQFLGNADILARRNVISMALLADLKPTDEISVGAHAYWFMRANDDQPLYSVMPDEDGNTGILGGSGRNAGFELNGYVGYQPEDHLKFTVGYNGFFTAGYLKDLENLSEFYVQGKLTF